MSETNKISKLFSKPPVQILVIVPAITFAMAFASSLLGTWCWYIISGTLLCTFFCYGLSILMITLLPTNLFDTYPKLNSYMKRFLNVAAIIVFGGIVGIFYLYMYFELKMPGYELLKINP